MCLIQEITLPVNGTNKLLRKKKISHTKIKYLYPGIQTLSQILRVGMVMEV